MTIRPGHLYRLIGTEREGIVTAWHPPVAMWAEKVPGWPYMNAPTAVFCDKLEPRPMRDSRGEQIEPGREAA